jgi:hypothetical protein
VSEPSKSPHPGRRQALKKLAVGAGAAWFPILGQFAATPAMIITPGIRVPALILNINSRGLIA